MKRTGFLFFVSVMFIFNLTFTGVSSGQQDRSAEIDKYIEMLDSKSVNERINAGKMIVRSGLTETRLFDIINERLLNIDPSRMHNSDYVDELSWYCKALASSGRSEYRETLKTVIEKVSDDKLINYATQSLGLFEKYARRNELMADTSDAAPGQSPEVTRYINMLRSGDISLIKGVAKDVYRTPSRDPVLFEVISEVLLEGYQKNTTDRNHVDTMSWLCKALGASGNPVYRETLKTIIKNTSNQTLIRYATQSLGMLN